ncbi:hypothetical protein DER46DRAFT_128819 [Fusarium sp. MPI-SDFR-AT-0072]|nr:hypothetical protein DER46DRAFT_128819 [Fusarium sp. MPI-SDFR-AT-0072]
MASVDIKNDYSMEAGLLSTDREERTMSSKEALLQDSESAQTIPRTKTRRISPAGKALIALAACCLLGVGVASIGGATRFCPGHLRHGDVVGKHGMNAHRPNLSDSMAQMVRRQNTPAPTDTEQGTGPTDAASDGASNAPSGGSSGGASGGASNTVQQPTATAEEPTNKASETAVQPSATAEEPTDQASATDEASNTQAQPSVTQPSATSRPSATARPTEDSATEASPSATESQEEPTEPASTAASTQRTTRRTTENRPEPTENSSPESTTDDSEATATVLQPPLLPVRLLEELLCLIPPLFLNYRPRRLLRVRPFNPPPLMILPLLSKLPPFPRPLSPKLPLSSPTSLLSQLPGQLKSRKQPPRLQRRQRRPPTTRKPQLRQTRLHKPQTLPKARLRLSLTEAL